MPQLPDYTALGGIPDANSGRPIASARSMHPEAIAQGIEQLGAGLQSAGNSLDAVAERDKRQANLVGVANADADSLKRLQELHQTVTSDNDYATQPKRFQDGSNAIIQSSAGAIADPRMRALWIADAQKTAVARLGVVETQAATGVRQGRGVQLEDNLKTYQSIYANPATDEPTRQQALANIKSTIGAAQNEALITPDGAQQWTTSYVQGSDALLAQARTKTKAGNAAVIPPASAGGGDTFSRMLIAENAPGNPSAVSPAGALGLAQVKPGTARDVAKGLGMANVAGMSHAEMQQYFATPEGAKANVAIGRAYFDKQSKELGSEKAAVIAYNAGPEVAKKWLASGHDDSVLPAETKAYIGKVLSPDGTTPLDHPAPGPGGPRANFANEQNMGDPRTPGWEQANLTTIQAPNGQSWQVNKKAAAAFQGFLQDLQAEGYDPKSSGGYNYRTIRGSGKLSQHAFGTAIDIGAAENPMGGTTSDLPANVGELAAKHGLVWGGNWQNRKDPMHFEWAGGGSTGETSSPPDLFSTAYGNLRNQYPSLSAGQVYALANEAVATHNSFRVEDRASLEGVVQDVPAAIQTTGGYSGDLPTRQQFTDAYGPQEGAQKYSQFQAAIGVSKTVHDMLTMPAADIQATVDASRATNGGAGAALDAQKAATIQTAAESTLKAREADPASYTLQAFPQIKQAWTDAQQSHDFAGALRMTSAAQTQLGIPADKQALIPKGMAADIVTAGKDETKTPAERLGAISGLVLATQDKGQRQAILQQLVKAGLPQSIDRSLDAAARGDAAGAQLLFAAATVDPTKLPGEIDAGGWLGSSGTKIKSSDIETKIQAQVMAPGKIGDAVYGLNDGNLDNMQRAQNDGVLLKNGVKLEMLQNGGDVDAAIARVSKALYGDLKPITQGQVAVAAPAGIDETQLVDGLDAQKEAARQELNRFGLVNEGKTPQDKQIARMAGMDKDRHIQSILDNGVWRNVGDGYGLFDKASGLFVAGPDGKPFVVTPDQALQAAVTQTGTEPPAAAPTPGQYQEMKRGGPAGRFRADFGQTPAFAAPAPAPVVAPAAPQDNAAAALRQRQMEVDQRRKKMGLPPFYPDVPK